MKQSHCVLDRPGKPSCRSRTEVTLGNEQDRSGRTADSSSHPSVWKWQGSDDNNMTYLSQNPQIYFNSPSSPFSWACYITSVITYSGGWSREIKASLDDTKTHLPFSLSQMLPFLSSQNNSIHHHWEQQSDRLTLASFPKTVFLASQNGMLPLW